MNLISQENNGKFAIRSASFQSTNNEKESRISYIFKNSLQLDVHFVTTLKLRQKETVSFPRQSEFSSEVATTILF